MKSALNDLAVMAIVAVTITTASILRAQSSASVSTSVLKSETAKDEPTADAPSTLLPEKAKSSQPEVKIFKLKFADPTKLADQLHQFVDGKIIDDPRTSQIIVSASKHDLEIAESLINSLDSATPQQPGLSQFAGRGTTPVRRGGGGGIGGGFGSAGFSGTGSGGGFGAISASGGTIPPSGVEATFQSSSEGSTASAGPTSVLHAPAMAIDLSNDQKKLLDAQLKSLDKQLAQSDADAKRTAATQQALDAILKQLAANDDSSKAGTNKTDVDLQANLRQLLEGEKLAVEQQKRMIESQKRVAEQQYRAAEAAQHQAMQGFQPPPSPGAWGVRSGSSVRDPFNYRGLVSDPAAAKMEIEIQTLARKIHQLTPAGDDSLTKEQQASRDELKQQLIKLLNEQLEQHVRSQTDELKQLRERLDKLEKELSERSKNRESIIDRRMDDLLSGNTPQAVAGPKTATIVTDSDEALPVVKRQVGSVEFFRPAKAIMVSPVLPAAIIPPPAATATPAAPAGPPVLASPAE